MPHMRLQLRRQRLRAFRAGDQYAVGIDDIALQVIGNTNPADSATVLWLTNPDSTSAVPKR